MSRGLDSRASPFTYKICRLLNLHLLNCKVRLITDPELMVVRLKIGR